MSHLIKLQTAHTAFSQDEAEHRQKLNEAPIRFESFTRKLKRCALQRCRGMCCYDGVYVSQHAAVVIADVCRLEADFFNSVGLALPEDVIVEGVWQGAVDGLKTAVKPQPFSVSVSGWPGHFNDTACVFLDTEGRCGLQLLSVKLGQHPWTYKPFGCWLHPIATADQGQPALVLLDEEHDPHSLKDSDYVGYVSCTHCGATEPTGSPAYEVLADEITFLGKIVGRRFLEEVRQFARSDT